MNEKDVLILAIESSCDETAASVVKNGRTLSLIHIQMCIRDSGVGDTVRHIKFGTGTVQAIVDGGKDYEVTVDFDKAGTKKMFASFAKLKKITE